MAINRAVIGAYRKGKKAKADGLPVTACPYKDTRTYRGGITWSRTFMNAWWDGYQGKDGYEEKPRP